MNKDKSELTFQPYDLVLVKACNVANAAADKVAKFLALYEDPYKVKKRVARNTYILSNTQIERERGIFHAANLKPYRTERQAGVGIAREVEESNSDDSPGKASRRKRKCQGVSFL